MTDEHDPLDDALRAALHTDAADVHADDALLASIREAKSSSRGRRPFLLAAAAVVAVAAIASGLVIANRHDDQAVRLIDEPAPATTTSTTSTTRETTGTTTAGTEPGGPTSDRPALVALVREDGMLVTVDLETGEQRELLTFGDPRAPVEEDSPMGGSHIDGVDLSPDGQWIYFSHCCEPAVGVTFRMPVGGGEREVVGNGVHPRVSPDGRWVATVATGEIFIYDTSRPGYGQEVFRYDGAGHPHHLIWSPDGSRVAYVDGYPSVGDGIRTVRLLTWDGAVLQPPPDEHPMEGQFAAWDPDRSLTPIRVADEDLWLSYDTTFRWLLWVGHDGVVAQQHGFPDAVVPIEGLPKATSADW